MKEKTAIRLPNLAWILAAFIGVLGIGAACLFTREKMIKERSEDFVRSLQKSALILQSKLAEFEFGLQGMAGLYTVGNFDLKPDQVRRYAESRRLFENLKGAMGFGFIRFVPESQITRYEMAQQLLRPDFQIHRLSPALYKETRDEFVIETIEPIERNRPARGLDVSSESHRYHAALHALKTGHTTLTGKIQLVQVDRKEAGLLLYQPLYRGENVPKTEAERRRTIVGWTYAPILISSLVEAMHLMAESRLALRIVDVTDGEKEELFSTKQRPSETAVLPGLEHLSLEIVAYERVWRIEASPVSLPWNNWETAALVSTFIAISGLYMALLIWWRRTLSEKSLSEKNLRALKRWQSALLEGTDYGIIAMDLNGTIIEYNKGAQVLLGYEADEVIGRNTPALFHVHEEIEHFTHALSEELGRPLVPSVQVIVARLPEEGTDRQQWTFVRKDGTRFPAELHLSTILGEEGQPVGYLGIFHDLTEQVRMERELRQVSEAINRSSIVAMTDKNGRILEVNSNFLAVSGYSRDELIGKTHRVVNSGQHPPEFFEELWRTIGLGKIWTGEIQNRTKNGEFYWVHSVISPLFDAQGQVDRFLSIRFDVTEKKQAEARLVHSAQLASLGEMAAGIAHEINNPLAIIKGKTEILRTLLDNEAPDREKLAAHAERISQTVDRIARIVSGLRSFSRDSSTDPMQLFDLKKVIDETVALCQERFRNNEVELQVQSLESIEIECRPVQVSQALLNILGNAFDAVSGLTSRWVRINVEVFDSHVQVAVTDSGDGIPAATAKKIMQPFFTTKDIGKGTGLGLSISKGLIEDHGGRLYYDAQSLHTRFVIDLPRAQKQARAAS